METAVEFLEKFMKQNQYFIGNDLFEAINQAKQIEKHQIIEAMGICQRTNFYVEYECPEDYYNKTFKNK